MRLILLFLVGAPRKGKKGGGKGKSKGDFRSSIISNPRLFFTFRDIPRRGEERKEEKITRARKKNSLPPFFYLFTSERTSSEWTRMGRGEKGVRKSEINDGGAVLQPISYRRPEWETFKRGRGEKAG